jgi:hypothetical protein
MTLLVTALVSSGEHAPELMRAPLPGSIAQMEREEVS